VSWKGCWITAVSDTGPANDSGVIRVGQRILSVNGEDVRVSSKTAVASLIASSNDVTFELQYDPVNFQAIADGTELASAKGLLDAAPSGPPRGVSDGPDAAPRLPDLSDTVPDVSNPFLTPSDAPVAEPTSPPPPPPRVYDAPSKLDVVLDKSKGKIGMSVVEIEGGGVEISKISPGSVAHLTGQLNVGMRIFAVNGEDATAWTKPQCVDRVKRAEKLVLTVEAPPSALNAAQLEAEGEFEDEYEMPVRTRRTPAKDDDEQLLEPTLAKSVSPREVHALPSNAAQLEAEGEFEDEYEMPVMTRRTPAKDDDAQLLEPTLAKAVPPREVHAPPSNAVQDEEGLDDEYVLPVMTKETPAPDAEEALPTLAKSALPRENSEESEDMYGVPIMADSAAHAGRPAEEDQPTYENDRVPPAHADLPAEEAQPTYENDPVPPALVDRAPSQDDSPGTRDGATPAIVDPPPNEDQERSEDEDLYELPEISPS
jgi:hypothetical protein